MNGPEQNGAYMGMNRQEKNHLDIETPKSVPAFPETRKISHHDFEVVKSFSESHRLPYSDFNFLSLLNNNVHEGFKISQLNESLVIRFLDYSDQKPFYSFIGGYDVEKTIDQLMEQSKKENIEPKLKLIPEETLLLSMGKLQKRFNIEEDPNNYDYVYKISDLANLEGGKFKGHRNQRSKFIRKNPDCQIVYYKNSDTKPMLKNLLETVHLWETPKKNTDEMAHLERSITRMINYSKYFDLFNVGIYVNGKLEGFCLNELIKNKFVMSHFIRANIKHAGIYQFFDNAMACKLDEMGYKYTNWQQDLGIPNIRQMKMDSNPIGFIKKYTVSPK
jgi:hypothetical protein